ncbi:myosin-14-like, partial [Alligator sinensis]|uniref:Myosin-14-like n=1 Tax=Alligator sinensis TaxID=38654 RepID=A0A1U7SMH6_ALLSI
GRLQELEALEERVEGARQQLLNTEELEQRLSSLELAQMLSKQKLERAFAMAERIATSDPISKLSAFQAEVKQAISELRGDLPSRADLAVVQSQLKHLQATELEALKQGMDWVLSSGPVLEQSVASLGSSLASNQRRMEEHALSLQTLQQKTEHTQVTEERLEKDIDSLFARTSALEHSLNHSMVLTQSLQLQVEENSKQLAGMKETVANQSGASNPGSQQLENIWAQIQQLLEEKAAMQERVSNALHSIADQRRELKGRTSKLKATIDTLQGHVTRVELGTANLNAQLTAAVEQQLLGLKLSMDKLESSLGTRFQQCLSGEVRTHCEMEDGCGWPHLREVSFPRRVLTQPAIMLGLAGLSAHGSVGVSVRAVDVTDSGFKIHITNVGNHSLSSVRVSWILCA